MINRWTKQEDEIIITKYRSMNAKELQQFLPNRTTNAIQERAKLLGVRKNNRWTKDEEDILREHYPAMGSRVSSMLPNHSSDACTDRANRIGLKKYATFWSEEEDNILKQFYPTMGRKVSEKLANRTPRACYDRAKLLGLKIKRKPSERAWTEEEDIVLFKYYPIMGPDVCFKIPNRTRYACSKHARQLGLRKGQY